MNVLVDTNVLLRRTQPNHEHHRAAKESVLRLLDQGAFLHITAQNIGEFWNVATRPLKNNGLGFSVAQAVEELEKLERALQLLPDTPGLYPEWKKLIIKHSVLGSKIHDARLVASMNVHNIRRILTFNGSDFARYGVEVLHPDAV